ncbi:abortive infection family protein [Shewanella algae]
MDSGIMRNSELLIRESPDRYKLTRTITAINAGIKDNESGLVIGQCKALVESLCKSILSENSIDIEANISVGKLAKKAGTVIGVGNEYGEDQKTKEAFIKLINSFTLSLENAISSIGTLRNEYCPLAHGRSSDQKPLHMLYAEFVASQTDALIVFFLNLIEHKKNFVPEVNFSENEDFNEYLVEEFGEIEIYGDKYQAPDILYQMNAPKYKTALSEYRTGGGDD